MPGASRHGAFLIANVARVSTFIGHRWSAIAQISPMSPVRIDIDRPGAMFPGYVAPVSWFILHCSCALLQILCVSLVCIDILPCPCRFY